MKFQPSSSFLPPGPDSEDVVRRMGRIGRIERERTVYIELCPSGVEPKQLFPSIQSVTPVEPKGTTALMFATAEEAKRVAGMVPTKVFGSRWVRLSWGGVNPRPHGPQENVVLDRRLLDAVTLTNKICFFPSISSLLVSGELSEFQEFPPFGHSGFSYQSASLCWTIQTCVLEHSLLKTN